VVDRFRQQSVGAYALCVTTIDPATEVACTATGSPSVVVTDGGGVQVYTGAATIAGTTLTAAVPVASLPLLDTYTAVWGANVSGGATTWRSYFEVCGGVLFEIADFRVWDPSFADTTKFPAAMLRTARVAGEQRFERAARLAYVPRCRRWSRQVKGYPMPIGYGIGYDAGIRRLETHINAVRTVRSVTINGAAMAPADLANLDFTEWGAIDQPPGGYWLDGSAVQVVLECGLDFPPAPVATAAMILTREYVIRSALSSRATVEATDVGFFRLSVAGPGRPTGIPEVDAAVAEFGRRRPRA
jgi:hypothetical protein